MYLNGFFPYLGMNLPQSIGKKASISYHSTATAVFSRIFLTPSPLVPRNLPIHVAANEDVSQLPEIIISPVDS